MFRIKSKANEIIKIKDIKSGKIASIGKNWVYLDNEVFLNSQDIKSNLSNLEVETDTPKYKKKVIENQSMKVENQNGMFTTSPIEKETIEKIDLVEIPNEEKSTMAVEEKIEEQPMEEKVIEENKEEIVKKPINVEKKDKKTKEDIIINADKDINKTEKTSRRGRKPKSEATK